MPQRDCIPYFFILIYVIPFDHHYHQQNTRGYRIISSLGHYEINLNIIEELNTSQTSENKIKMMKKKPFKFHSVTYYRTL